MTKLYKSARGKSVDIDKIKLANETTVAVGNMKVNARGDVLGAGGKVTASRNQVMDKVYAVPSEGYSPNNPEVYKQRQAIMANNKAQELNNLVNNLTVPISQEPTPETTAPAARGSLASSLAKTTTVVQEPIPDPKKAKTGPSRI